jgi:hypothetical protein
MYALKNRVKDRISLGDKDKLNQLIEEILTGERVLGTFIGQSLSNISNMAEKASQSETGYNEARNAVSQMRDTLRSDRHRLIEAEIMFYESIRPKSSKIKDETTDAKEKPWYRRLVGS